jgi:hypothetical protein
MVFVTGIFAEVPQEGGLIFRRLVVRASAEDLAVGLGQRLVGPGPRIRAHERGVPISGPRPWGRAGGVEFVVGEQVLGAVLEVDFSNHFRS